MSVVHAEPHPRADETVLVRPALNHQLLKDGAQYVVKDWWDRVAGESWQEGTQIAVLQYAARAGAAGLPDDDEVVYGKIGGLGYLVHQSELE